MAHSDQADHITVFDSEGIRGTMPAHALHQPDGQVSIDFGQGLHIQVPLDILHRREDGTYRLPMSLRELNSRTATSERAVEDSTNEENTGEDSEDNIVAVIPVVVEEARVAKREVETGRVRIHKTVHQQEEQVDVPLLRDQVHVERVPVQRYLQRPAEPHYQGRTLVIPVMEEVLVVQKRLLLREEIHVTTVREQVRHQESVMLQREQVTVTRAEPERTAPVHPDPVHPDKVTTHQDTHEDTTDRDTADRDTVK